MTFGVCPWEKVWFSQRKIFMVACPCNTPCTGRVSGACYCLTKRWEVTRLPLLTSEGNRRMFVDEHLAEWCLCLLFLGFWPKGYG